MSAPGVVDVPMEKRIGPHLFRWEPPDLIYIAYFGVVDGDTMSAMNAESRQVGAGRKRLFILADMSRVGQSTKEARHRAAEGSKGMPLRGVALVGASAPQRIIAGLVTRGIAILSRNHENPTRFFETEAQGRAWIEQRRRELDAE